MNNKRTGSIQFTVFSLMAALVAPALVAQDATPIHWDIRLVTGNSADRTIMVTPLDGPLGFYNTNLAMAGEFTLKSSHGVADTNLVIGNYKFSYSGIPKAQIVFWPGDPAITNAADSRIQRDGITLVYAVTNSGFLAAGTNVTVRTNGVVSTVSVTTITNVDQWGKVWRFNGESFTNVTKGVPGMYIDDAWSDPLVAHNLLHLNAGIQAFESGNGFQFNGGGGGFQYNGNGDTFSVNAPLVVNAAITAGSISGTGIASSGNVTGSSGSFGAINTTGPLTAAGPAFVTNSFTAYGSNSHTNALNVSAAGVTISNANGTAFFSSGNQTNSGNVQASSFIGSGVALTGVNATNGAVEMSSGSQDEFADMNAGAATYRGQLGTTWAGSEVAFWAAQQAGVGSNAWRAAISFYGGINNIGDNHRMPGNGPNAMNIYLNGNALDARFNQATNGTRLGSYLSLHNLNVFSDGSGFCVPHYTTNVNGTAVLTNADGVKIYLKNAFGNQLLTIPEEYAWVGETNQAGSYVWLTQPDLPTYISQNMQIPGESGGFYSQHYFVGFDSRGAGVTTDTKNFGVHFPIEVPYVWTFTNANNRDAMFIDVRYGSVYFGSNLFINGYLLATQQNGSGVHYLGPAWASKAVAPTLGIAFGTNTAFAPKDDAAFTWDSQDSYRLGVVKQNGAYPKFAHAAGAPLIIARSGSSSLQAPVAGQTFTDEITIDASGNATFAGTVAIGSGTAIGKVLSASATLDFPSTSAQTSSELTITVTGAASGDVVSLGLPAAPNANTCFTAYVSAADTVKVRFNNYSSGAVDPASGTYRAQVTHF